jgi:hypothetical protein
LVLEQLSLRNLARAARTCRELAAHVRQQRRSLQVVVVPEGVSLTAVRCAAQLAGVLLCALHVGTRLDSA